MSAAAGKLGAPRGARRRYAWLLPALLAALLLLGGCASRKGTARGLRVDANLLYERARKQLDRRELRQARDTLEQIRGYSEESRDRLQPLVQLMLADITYYQGSSLSLISARSAYLEFVTLNGDHPRAPYAQLQAGVCSLKQANTPSRDQTESHQAIHDLKEVVRRYPDSAYARAARDKIDEAERLLAEHEFLVGRFYLKKKAYLAAAARFRRVLDQYPGYEEKDKVFLHLGQALLQGGDEAEGRLYLGRVVQEHPESDWAAKASKLLGEKNS